MCPYPPPVFQTYVQPLKLLSNPRLIALLMVQGPHHPPYGTRTASSTPLPPSPLTPPPTPSYTPPPAPSPPPPPPHSSSPPPSLLSSARPAPQPAPTPTSDIASAAPRALHAGRIKLPQVSCRRPFSREAGTRELRAGWKW